MIFILSFFYLFLRSCQAEVMKKIKRGLGRPPKNKSKKQKHPNTYYKTKNPKHPLGFGVAAEVSAHWHQKKKRTKRGDREKFSTSSSPFLFKNCSSSWLKDFEIPGPVPP